MASLIEGPTLGSRIEGRDNNLNLIRMILASAVLISHSVPLSMGPGVDEPLQSVLHFSLGHLAVFGFFFVSGLLVTQSLCRRQSLVSYVEARVLRIFPGLAVVLLITVAVLAPAITTLSLSQYLFHLETWTYLPKNLTLLHLQYGLPGVFAFNPYQYAINGSLWTLPFEVGCYILLGLLWITGVLRGRPGQMWLGVTCVALFVVAALAHLSPRVTVFLSLLFCFVLGSAFYFARHRLVLNRWFAVVGLALVICFNYFLPCQWLLSIAFSYCLVTFGYLTWKPLSMYNRLGDYSYGTYIYAFPVQQFVVFLAPGILPVTLAAIAFPITLSLAVLSWHLIEGPALKLKNRAASLSMLPVPNLPRQGHLK